MPTNDERREVAARLRNIVGYCSRDIIEKIQETCRCNTGLVWEDVMEFKNRLAELIESEPERTCTVKPNEYTDSLNKDWQAKLSCGHEVLGKIEDISYCPKCGAKVTER